jgi:type I restriction enzyme S subunit
MGSKFKIRDLIEKGILKIGDGYRAKNSELTSVGFPFARVNTINKGFNFENIECLPYERRKDFKDKVSQVNDIVFTSKGTVGRFAFVKPEVPEFVFSPQVCYWRVLDVNVINPLFLYYWMQSTEFVRQCKSMQSETDMADYISLTNQNLITISLPPLPVQKRIAEILSAFDDKIELNRKMNQTLEEMARTLFKRWFVEEEREEWTKGVLSDEFDFTMGQSPPGSMLNENGEGIVFFQGCTDFGFRFPKNRVYTTLPTRTAKKFETLISVRAPVGDMNVALNDCALGRGVAAFRYKINPNYFSYCFYKLNSIIEQVKQFEDTGTVFGSISKNDFANLKITIPPFDLAKEFQSIVSPLDEKIYCNSLEIQTLSSLRDALLPRLLNGEIDIKI